VFPTLFTSVQACQIPFLSLSMIHNVKALESQLNTILFSATVKSVNILANFDLNSVEFNEVLILPQAIHITQPINADLIISAGSCHAAIQVTQPQVKPNHI
jgi:hypothetical protein